MLVTPSSSVWGRPRRIDRANESAPFVSAATTRTGPGRSTRSIPCRMPMSNPPPPTHVTNASTGGAPCSASCASTSSTRDAWPAHVVSPSKGWTSPRPVSSASASAAAFASSQTPPSTRTSAPYSLSSLAFTEAGVVVGSTTVHAIPNARAACAVARPALPPDELTTPSAPASTSSLTAAPMPRSLNEPDGWKQSILRKTSAPSLAESGAERTNGVTSCSARAPAAASAVLTQRIALCSYSMPLARGRSPREGRAASSAPNRSSRRIDRRGD
mmetsp:Transcript_22495/g.70486  ORF Transcript_22495/g.70486 Transcript_22495/m.70486 type:complete len:272 (+) Transcript_22495:234-1049(+)